MPKLPAKDFINVFKAKLEFKPTLNRELHTITENLVKGGVKLLPNDKKYNFNEKPELTPEAALLEQIKLDFLNKGSKKISDKKYK